MNTDTVNLSIRNGDSFELPAGETLFKALRDKRVYIPTVCGGKGLCGKCRLKILSGAPAELSAPERRLLSEAEITDGWRLSCQVAVNNDLVIELPDEIRHVKMFEAVVTELEMMCHDVRRVRLHLSNPPVMDYLPGAFIALNIPPSPESPRGAVRSYSISTPPESAGEIELNVKLVPGGTGSGYIHNGLAVGDRVTFTAPYSGYPFIEDPNELICIAGGSGVSPVLSLLRRMVHTRNPRKTSFFFGVRTSGDLCCIDELRFLEKALPGFRLIPVVQFPDDDENSQYETGLVTDALERNIQNAAGVSAYLCGSPGMLAACCEILIRLGIREDKLFFDRFA